MKSAPYTSYAPQAVSIITCTKRPDCMNRLFDNYSRQTYKNKELIVILNHKDLNLDVYRKRANQYRNVRVFRVPDHVSLGRCLNYGVKLAKYGFIAKFDDDDYYAPNYLSESMRLFLTTKADVVGKRAHFMKIGDKKELLYRYYTKANQYVSLVQGATLLIKRHVFDRIAFPNQNRGECVKFCAACRREGFRIYSGSPYNFVAMRKPNSKNHTWIVSDKQLLTRHVKVLPVEDMKPYITR